MTIEYKATVQHKDGMVVPIVDEYHHGEYKRSLTFADAPKFEDIFMAFNYAKTEADELNRRVHHEER
jgi:hypothetical protein